MWFELFLNNTTPHKAKKADGFRQPFLCREFILQCDCLVTEIKRRCNLRNTPLERCFHKQH
jgi:hypothetical protein